MLGSLLSPASVLADKIFRMFHERCGQTRADAMNWSLSTSTVKIRNITFHENPSGTGLAKVTGGILASLRCRYLEASCSYSPI